jgi:hypothetical protein
MATKTANVNSRNGIPFSVTLPTYVPARDEIKTDDQPKT